MVAAAAMKTAAETGKARTAAIAPTVLAMIALAAVGIALFVTRHLVAYAIAHVVAITIAFVSG